MIDTLPNAVFNVLFLCTGNSARSILAESLLRYWGRRRFRAYSAGSEPRGEIQPHALEVLTAHGLPTEGLYSKAVTELFGAGAPKLDFIITVCDRAAEQCPIFPGRPITAHWSTPDPAAVTGDDAARQRAFRTALCKLGTQVQLLTGLPLDALDQLARQQRVRAIGRLGEPRCEKLRRPEIFGG